MKKFTSLFLLFLVCFVHNLGAQQTMPEMSTPQGKKYYKIKNARANKYATYKGDAGQMTLESAFSEGSLFYFEEVTEQGLATGKKKVKIGNKATTKYCAEYNSFTNEGIAWYLFPQTNGSHTGFAISKTVDGGGRGDAWNDYRGDGVQVNYWVANDAGSIWTFEALTPADITAIFNTTKAVYKDKAKQITFDLTDKAYTDYVANVDKVGISTLDEIETKKAELENLLTTYTNQMTASFYAKIKNAHFTAYYFSGDGNRLFGVNSETSYKTYWKFEWAANKKGYTLYNPYNGKYLSAPTNGNPGWTDKNNAGVYYFTRPTPNNDLVFALTSTAISGNNNSIHMNPVDNVIYWEASAGASKWTITKQTISEQQLTDGINTEKGIAEKQAVIDAMTTKATFLQERVDANSIKTEGTPGYHLVGFNDFNAWNTFLNEVKQSKTTETLQALQDKQKKLNASLVANDVTGKFYRLACASRSKGHIAYAEPYYSTNAITGDNPNGIDARGLWYDTVPNVRPAAALWTLEVATDAADRYYVKNVNSNMYVSRINSMQHTDMPVSKDWAGKFFLGKYTHTTETNDWNLSDHINNGTFLSTDNQSKKVNAWTSAQDVGAGWKFEEVTTFPVTIGNAKYATLNLPFGVEIAQGDKANLKAYIGQKNSANANEFVVAEITDGIIPANTPVILHATAAATYTLNITTKTSTVALTNNELEGTTIANHKMTSGNYYGLGVLKNGTVGFKLANTPNMAANKAYLPKPAGAQAAALSFVFEGQQTGINGVTTEEVESNVYYDLNGRRVLYPTTGLYINAKGQKVFLK